MVGGQVIDDQGGQINIPNILPAEKDAEKAKFEPLTKILVGAEYIRYDGIERLLRSKDRFIMLAKGPGNLVMEASKYDIIIIDKISCGYGGNNANDIISQLETKPNIILISVSPEKESGIPPHVAVIDIRDRDGLRRTVDEMERGIRANRNN